MFRTRWTAPKAPASRRSHRTRKLRFDTLEDRAVPAAPVINPIPDQTLASNQAVRQVPIPATDADGDPLTFTAKAAGTEAFFLATDLGLKPLRRPVNWGGQGEKWFQGAGGPYFLKPNGDFHQWDGTPRQATGPLLASLPPAFFLFPDLLTRPSDADLAALLDRRLGLTTTATPATNSLGLGEQWLLGTGRVKYFLTPAGELYRSTGAPLGAVRTLVARLDPAYFNDIRLLAAAKPHPLPVSVGGGLVTIGPAAGAAGEFAVRVTAADATATAARTFQVRITNLATPVAADPGPQVLGAGETLLRLDLGASDADGDALAYQVELAGTEAYFLAGDLGLKPDLRRRPNWGGQAERWFLGRDGSYFLAPSGDFRRWNGVDREAGGQRVATLPPVYYHYPDLLTRPSDEDLAHVIDRKLRLSPTIIPAENSLGLGERWLKGKAGLFFITPPGDLYRQGRDAALLANLGPVYFRDLDRLYAAQPDRYEGAAPNGVLEVTTKPNYFGRFVARVRVTDGVNTTAFDVPVEQRFVPPPADGNLPAPRVVSALSTGNRKVVVTFSQAMSNTAVNPANYGVVTTNVNPEAGGLIVTGARFVDDGRDAVELTTLSQSTVTYTVGVSNVRDLAGKTIAPPSAGGVGVIIDPSKANFAGTGPSPADLVDTDGDGLTDDMEQRGYEVEVRLLNGSVVTRGVTSDPFVPDTDADGLPDGLEANLGLDPRDTDTDDDQLDDYREFNEIYSTGNDQDSDGDGLDDNIEYGFYRTSPNQPDTDGDQLLDGAEVLLGNRNARVADLPAPTLSISGTDLRLDVRFTEETATQSRVLENKSVSSTLTQSDKKSFSNTDSSEYEVGAKISTEYGTETTTGVEVGTAESKVSFEFKQSFKLGTEVSTSGKWSSSHTSTSEQETQDAYTRSQSTDKERTEGATLNRQVVGAAMRATVFLRNPTNLAFRVKNLQLTASIQDPQDPTRLTPVATLVPDAEPADGYTLGPLGADRGPIVFSNTTVFPNLVESLMANPRGLVFQFSNYDIVDEVGRNFAFIAREVIDRTTSLVIDYGGFDSDGDGEGDFAEYRRVASSGGRVIDTDGDGDTDADDRRVLFDADGKEVGLTLRDSLAALGLKHFYERVDATHEARLLARGIDPAQIVDSNTLTDAQLRGSYATYFSASGFEHIWRVRTTGRTAGSAKMWEVITPTGIDRSVGLDDQVLTTEAGIRLGFVQDVDLDGLPANLEFLNNTSDDLKDTDGDGLDDRFELLIGWDVDVVGGRQQGIRRVFSRASLADTDGDGLTDAQEAPRIPLDRNGDGLPDEYQRDPTDADGDGKPDDLVTDPSRADTDGDEVRDKEEVDGYDITLYGTATVINRKTDPTNFDTDGDTASDGLERRLGGDPTDISDRDKFSDSDGDGLVNIVETDGWDISVWGLSAQGFVQPGAAIRRVTSNPAVADTDGDGLTDGQEFRFTYNPSGAPNGDVQVRTDPGRKDTDGDGLDDNVEALGFNLREDGIILLDPADADTDNDKLSDGEEAELQDVETAQWIVRVIGGESYRVFSNPRRADQDFDGLVDGDEKYVYSGNFRGPVRMSDPANGNTDGDRRGDGQEVVEGLNPLQEDFKVTVVFDSLTVDEKGDGGSNAGDFGFDLGIRRPDGSTATGLSNSFTSVVREQLALTGTFNAVATGTSEVKPNLPAANDPNDFDETLVRNNYYGIPIGTGQTLGLAGLIPDAARSVTFSMTTAQRFSIEAAVGEIDTIDFGAGTDDATYVFLGGLDGVRATKENGDKVRGVFQGSDLVSQADSIQTLSFEYTTDDNREGKDNGGDRIAGKVRVYYLVN